MYDCQPRSLRSELPAATLHSMALLHGERILLVGPDSPFQRVLCTALGVEGAQFTTVAGASAALQTHDEPSVLLVELPASPEAALLKLPEQLRARRAANLGPLPALALLDNSDGAGSSTSEALFQKRLVRPCSALDVVLAIVSCVGARATAPVETAEKVAFSLLPHLTRRALQKDMRGTLALLNSTTVFRFTAIFRFDDERLTSIWAFDRKLPGADQFPLDATVSSSYCSFIRDSGEGMSVSDADHDPRVAEHPKRHALKAYCGVPLRRQDGSLYGSLCHFDFDPRLIADQTVYWLEEGARLLSPGLP